MSKRLYRENSDAELTGSDAGVKTKRANRFIKLKVPYKGTVYFKSNEISRGSHSVVYKVFNRDETKVFAGKELQNTGIQLHKKRIFNEIQVYKITSERSNNINIVKMIDWFQNKRSEEIYMILEYCSEGSLLSLLHYRKKFPEQHCKWIILQILHGLYSLHSNNIVHGDLKLSNILIDGNGHLKLSDFGHSFVVDMFPDSQKSDEISLGTPTYLAPEIIYRFKGINSSGLTNKSISYPIDLWSLGVILYYLVYGNNPFTIFSNNLHKMTYDELMYKITSNKIEFPHVPDTSINLKKVILKLLRQHPLKRLTKLELLTSKWMREDFTTNFNLLTDQTTITNVSDSKKHFLGKLKDFEFIYDRNDNVKNKKMTLKKLIHKAKHERTKLNFEYDSRIKILSIIATNHIKEPTTCQIIRDESKFILSNLSKLDWIQNYTKKTCDQNFQPTASTEDKIFITKNKVIYANKHHIQNVYQLSNGHFGCFFNDMSDQSILMNERKGYLWYICTDNKFGYISKSLDESKLNKLPTEVIERIDLLRECKMELDMDTDNDHGFINTITHGLAHQVEDNNVSAINKNQENRDIFLRKYIIFQDEQLELYLLSNSTVQIVDNLQEKIILVERFGHLITWSDNSGSLVSMTYESLISSEHLVHSDTDRDYIIGMIQILKGILKREVIEMK